MMPKRSGWEVCQALKARAADRRASRVVLVTGRGEVKDRLTGLQVGADDYLVKPFDRDEVVKRITALLEREQRERRRPDDQTGREAASRTSSSIAPPACRPCRWSSTA